MHRSARRSRSLELVLGPVKAISGALTSQIMAVPGNPLWTAMVLALCVLLAMAVFQLDLRQGNKAVASKATNATLLHFLNRRSEEHKLHGFGSSEDYSTKLENEDGVQDQLSNGLGPLQSEADKLRTFSLKAKYFETPLDSLLITNGSLKWTEGLERTIFSMLTQLQYPNSCAETRKLYVEMDVSGKLLGRNDFQTFVQNPLLI